MRPNELLAHLDLRHREEIGIFRELDDNGARELGKIAGRGDLTFFREAVDVDKVGAGHTEPGGSLIHARNETFRAAPYPFGEHDSDVIRRFDDEDLEAGVDRDLPPDRQAEFA